MYWGPKGGSSIWMYPDPFLAHAAGEQVQTAKADEPVMWNASRSCRPGRRHSLSSHGPVAWPHLFQRVLTAWVKNYKFVLLVWLNLYFFRNHVGPISESQSFHLHFNFTLTISEIREKVFLELKEEEKKICEYIGKIRKNDRNGWKLSYVVSQWKRKSGRIASSPSQHHLTAPHACSAPDCQLHPLTGGIVPTS